MCRFAVVFLLASVLHASVQRGMVTFGGLPVPGATVMASQGKQRIQASTDLAGSYSFADLADGVWTVEVQMTGFAALKRDVVVSPTSAPEKWELTLLPLNAIKAAVIVKQAPPSKEADTEGLLINGSTNNGAASPFAQAQAFGNNRNGGKSLYNGGIGLIFDNSALDAKPFSITGQDTPKAAYNRLRGTASLGGPLKFRRLWQTPPTFFIAYQWARNNDTSIQPGTVPTLAERSGILAGEIIPQSKISAQARALLSYYPLPNLNNGGSYNYQASIVNPSHVDSLQTRLNKSANQRNQIFGRFSFLDSRSNNNNLFGFRDTDDFLGLNGDLNWFYRINTQLSLKLGYQFSRMAERITPYFANKLNVSGLAGIGGNDQSPINWGPPSLTFSGGTAGLSDQQSSFTRKQTSGVSYSMIWNRGKHNVTFGTDFRRQEFNYLSQQDPRGSFTFTGAASGSDLGDFLLGVPDTSSIAFGNADKYLRQSVYDGYITDDWRVTPELSIDAGIRWEYGAPETELYGRLVNLAIARGFTSATAVVNSLLQPDKNGFQPRIGLAWRSGSSLVVRAGYGIYDNTSVYQSIALQMAQQPPLSKTLSVQNSPEDPLTLANGFVASPTTTTNTFAVDPKFRVGYAQVWQVTVQRDLPASLQVSAQYQGVKGTRGEQEFLPNTYPAGQATPCPSCPVGFEYLASNGNSIRHALDLTLRRRLHSGLTASLQYRFSKSIDNDAALATGGYVMDNVSGFSASAPSLAVAQNWLNLRAERSLSSFDQRNVLNATAQYTTGMGTSGGTLLSGWKGALFKEWTFVTTIAAGSGMPETPIYLTTVQGTGFTGSVRADYTGAPVYSAPAGLFLNPSAYTAPLPGQWGNAGRNSITGPSQFSLNASLGRTFRLKDRFNLDLRFDSTNALNHVAYMAWNTTVNNAQFGLPVAANTMRAVETTLRLRF
jgi:hypothetical protein